MTEYPESQLQESNVLRESMAFLREHEHRNPDQPWLLCASFSRPHPPFTVPERHFDRFWPDLVTAPNTRNENSMSEAEMKARAAYFGCVEYLDELLGDFMRMLDGSGYLENTVIIYASDHGDMIGEHEEWGKGSWHSDSARVPFVLELPAHRRGEIEAQSVSAPVSLIDIYPTICGLTGTPVPDGPDGTDLSPAIRAGTEPDREPVFIDFLRGDGDFRAISDGSYKYVRRRNADDLLFDLESDPLERTNTIDDPEYSDVAERLAAIADDTMDFSQAEEHRQADRSIQKTHAVAVSRGTAGNAYLLGNDRVVDADVVRTKPDVLLDDAEQLFVDYPVETGGARGPTSAPAPDRDSSRDADGGRFQ